MPSEKTISERQAGINEVLRWLDTRPRYDLPAENGGCVIVLDLRDVQAAFGEGQLRDGITPRENN